MGNLSDYNRARMHPVLFEIPGLGFELRSFGPMVALGFLLCSWVFGRLARRYDPDTDPERWAELPIWVLVGILVGARLLYVLIEVLRGSETGSHFLSDPLHVLAFWEGGLVMYGGFFGGILAGLWGCRRNRIQYSRALDLGLASCFFGLFVGRIGCLLVGDDYGSVVPAGLADWGLPIVLHVPDPLPEGSLFGEHNAGRALYATQVWMSLNGLWMGFLGLWLLRRERYTGWTALVLVAVYAVMRFLIELFRGDEVRGVWFGGAISTSQLISIAAVVGVLVILIRNRSRREPAPG